MSTCMKHGIAIKRCSQPVRRGGEQERGKKMRKGGNERKGNEKIKKRKEKEKKKRKRKEADSFFLSSLAFRLSELVGPMSKVRRFDEGLRFKRLGFFLL